MRLLLTALLLTFRVSISAQTIFPTWFRQSYKEKHLDRKFSITPFLKKGMLQADFNGDKLTDIAVLVTEKGTEKKGILLFHQQGSYFLFGAGTKFGSGSDNFKWANGWEVYKEKTASETQFHKNGDIIGGREIKLQRPGITIWAEEDGHPFAGGIIYWTGQKYIWIHQGE